VTKFQVNKSRLTESQVTESQQRIKMNESIPIIKSETYLVFGDLVVGIRSVGILSPGIKSQCPYSFSLLIIHVIQSCTIRLNI
jgi:hypothetical protein